MSPCNSPCRHSQFYTNVGGSYIPPPPQPPANKKTAEIKVPSSTFSADWAKTINNPSHSDVVLRLEGKTYHAHRYVLASASDLFRQLLGVTQKVKVRLIVNLGECYGCMVLALIVDSRPLYGYRWCIPESCGHHAYGKTDNSGSNKEV